MHVGRSHVGAGCFSAGTNQGGSIKFWYRFMKNQGSTTVLVIERVVTALKNGEDVDFILRLTRRTSKRSLDGQAPKRHVSVPYTFDDASISDPALHQVSPGPKESCYRRNCEGDCY